MPCATFSMLGGPGGTGCEHIKALTQPLIKSNFAEHIFNTQHLIIVRITTHSFQQEFIYISYLSYHAQAFKN